MNEVLAEHRAGDVTIALVRGDVTEERVDAIVNAANSDLAHGGGVAAAICRKGGPEIQRESDAIGYVPVGQTALTTAGRLPARFVIHAVGPRWGEGDEDEKLRSAVRSSLGLAHDRGLASVSLPAISSGIYGFPKDRCAGILLAEADAFAAERPSSPVREVRFCLYDAPTIEAFRDAWSRRGWLL
jgi:O-acetyl-ADP-ribose deacetylase (regulator of RNase III)